MLQCCVCLSVCLSSVTLCIVSTWCVLEQKLLYEVVYEKSVGTKMNDLDLCLEVGSTSQSTNALHLTLNISETVRDRSLVPKNHQYEMACGLSNGHVTDDVT